MAFTIIIVLYCMTIISWLTLPSLERPRVLEGLRLKVEMVVQFANLAPVLGSCTIPPNSSRLTVMLYCRIGFSSSKISYLRVLAEQRKLSYRQHSRPPLLGVVVVSR